MSIREALESAQTALDDWLNTFAEDHCDPERVRQARERIHAVGTVGYIAEVQQKVRAALRELDAAKPEQLARAFHDASRKREGA